MSKTRTLILGVLMFFVSTACLSFGGLSQKVINKAIEKAELPDGALATAQVGLEALSTQVAVAAEASAEKEKEGQTTSEGGVPANVPYPLPDDARDISYVNEMLLFVTSLSPEEAVIFYEQALNSQGLTEKPGSRVVGENQATITFEGHPSGRPLAVMASRYPEGAYVSVILTDN